MERTIEERFEELYQQCLKRKQSLELLEPKAKKQKKADILKVKHLFQSPTVSHQKDSSGSSTDTGYSESEHRADCTELRDDTNVTSQPPQEELICMQQVAEDPTGEDEVTLLEEDISGDTSGTLSPTYTFRTGNPYHRQTCPSKTNKFPETRMRGVLGQLPHSANGCEDQDSFIPLFCDPSEQFGGVWQSIVVERDEGISSSDEGIETRTVE